MNNKMTLCLAFAAIAFMSFGGFFCEQTSSDSVIVNAEIDLINGTVSGNVTDSSGTPMEGVSVWIDDEKNKVTTDGDGHFMIDGVQMDLKCTIYAVTSNYKLFHKNFLPSEEPTVNIVLEKADTTSYIYWTIAIMFALIAVVALFFIYKARKASKEL